MAKKAPVAAPGRTRRHPRGAGAEFGHIAEGLRPLAVPIGTLLPDPANARRHSDRNIEAIKGSLQRYGQRRPVVVNRRTGTIEAGNATWEAARALGWAHLAVVYVEDDPTTAAGFSIADNRTAELGEWDDDALATVLEALKTEGELPHVGFSDAELDRLLRELRGLVSDGFSVSRALQAAPELAARVQPGQLWHLGPHRVLCGDATKAEDVTRLMSGERAVLLVTDPPYAVKYSGTQHVTDSILKGRSVESGRDWSEFYEEDEISDDPEPFFRAVFANAATVLDEHAGWYVWHAHKRMALIDRLWQEMGILNHQQVIWVKPAHVSTHSYWQWRHEACLFGWKQGHKPRHDGDGSASSTTVWECDYDGQARRNADLHPTQKPLEVFAKPIRKHTAPGEVVLDLFLGSGTALMAAELLGRRCYGMEIQPLFCAMTIARWEAHTGQSAVMDA